jgi:hypothetical protein
MFKKQHLALAIAATLAAGAAQAALETSVTLKNETAWMVKDGLRTGEATENNDTTGEGKGNYKFENTAKIYLNDEMDNGMSWHGELNVVYDTKAIDAHDGHENYSQQDWLRELYADTKIGDWDLRVGKQQVVWGTADGIKLLDMINPTDWREFNQNTMADARIPVWMLNAERYLDNGSNVQLILSQAERSKISGLDADGETRSVTYNDPFNFGGGGAVPSDNSQLTGVDAGSPFIMKGVDTITGAVNGFLNIGAAMGQVTTTFYGEGAGVEVNGNPGIQSFTNPFGVSYLTSGFGNANDAELSTVGGFVETNAAHLPADCGGGTGIQCLTSFTNATDNNQTNLIGSNWDPSNPDSTWEYMGQASFATFNTYVGMTTRYERKDSDGANFATRFRNTTSNGLNYSLNYAYAYDSNPVVNIHWEDSATGERLVAREFTTAMGTTVVQLQNQAGTTGYGAVANYNQDASVGGDADDINLYGWQYTAPADIVAAQAGGANETAGAGEAPLDVTAAAPATLVFEETLEQSHNLGASFDYALDTSDSSWVLRGEFLYQKDAHVPVVDRGALSRGNLTEALKSEKADMFKYVLGADTTVLTDMMVSGQFIQFRNLDYVDQSATCSYNTYQDAGDNPATQAGMDTVTYACDRYTADQASMHLTNGLKKAEKNKEFYSLFFSKPFGESGEGRWNNIFIYEEGGGKWNRFDVEYGINDQLIGTFEVNKYFGDENTMFGQFENASNVQIGLKYLLQ